MRFYVEGFRGMTLGRTLWALIAVKLLILFGVLRLFFFADPWAGESLAQRAGHVLERLAPYPAPNP